MHNGVIARLGLPLRYVPVDLPPGHLRGFLRIVRVANFLGGNVTIPYKEEAAALADTRSEAVEACGAANTLVVRKGKLHAENTDGAGFLDALEACGWGRRFRRAVLPRCQRSLPREPSARSYGGLPGFPLRHSCRASSLPRPGVR